MKVPAINRAAAYFMQIIAQTGGVIGVATLSFLYGRMGNFEIRWGLGVAIIASIAAAYAAGSLIGTIFFGIILHEPFRRIQGAPFKVGDQVIILKGPRKNKITEVYEVWYPRMQVRVRLTDDEAKGAADAYSDYEIMKIKQPNQSLQTTIMAVTDAAAQPPRQP